MIDCEGMIDWDDRLVQELLNCTCDECKESPEVQELRRLYESRTTIRSQPGSPTPVDEPTA